MAMLGFFDVAGQNDLPYVVSGGDSATAVQTSLLSFASGLASTASVRAANVHNRALCQTCHDIEYRCSSQYNKPEVQAACEQLAASVATGLSSEATLQAWLVAPKGASAVCNSACAPLHPTANFYAGGFERPYSKGE